MKAKFLRLNTKDFIKGSFVAIIAALITFLNNELLIRSPIDLQLLYRIGLTALIAFLSYLMKNLLTNSNDDLLTPEK